MPAPSSNPPAAHLRPSKKGPWLQIRSPKDFEFNRIDLPIVGLPPGLSGLRVLHLTDLHFRAEWFKPYDELIERVAADPPDLILFTGDLVEHHYDPRPAFETAGKLVAALSAKFGKFAILGNHDGDLLGPMWRGWGVTLINGLVCNLTLRGETVELIGLPGVHRDDLTKPFLSTLPARPDTPTLRIILSHYPDAIRQVAYLKPDLILAGHTHGGQICLPGGIPLLTHDTLPKSMSKGLHRLHDTWLLVGRGFGFSTWLFRTFCPAEVIEITLTAVAAN